MATFEDLQQALATSPEALFKQVDALNAKARRDLIVENIDERLLSNRIEDEDSHALLPREYRRQAGVRWDHFGYVLHYFDRTMLERHLREHLTIETGDSKATYLRNMLAMLVWMSSAHGSQEAEESPSSSKKNRRR